jgi:hypothetical protein
MRTASREFSSCSFWGDDLTNIVHERFAKARQDSRTDQSSAGRCAWDHPRRLALQGHTVQLPTLCPMISNLMTQVQNSH